MHKPLIAGSLFAGIGGFELGFAWAGITTAWSVELKPERRRVLKAHFPATRVYSDVNFVDVHDDLGYADVVMGGFPCQDVSHNGKREGIHGAKSREWFTFKRIVSALRPTYVIIENVAGLRSSGMAQVIGDLDSLGYMGEWESIPARTFGAPHWRDRVWIVGYLQAGANQDRDTQSIQRERDLADPTSLAHGRNHADHAQSWYGAGNPFKCRPPGADSESFSDLDNDPGTIFDARALAAYAALCNRYWQTEPRMDRVADGIPAELDRARRARIHALGDSLVPQIAAFIGYRLLLHHGSHLSQ